MAVRQSLARRRWRYSRGGRIACGHVASTGLGHTIKSLAIWKIFFGVVVWAPRLYRDTSGVDPERKVSVTLLTNRTWPDCTNQAIKEVRPAFHDAVMQALGVAQ